MYLTKDTAKYWTIDVEGDLIPSTRIWVVCAKNVKTGEEVRLRSYEEIKSWFDARVLESCKFIGHNIIGYDAPTLNRIIGTKLTISMLVDTMLMSMVYSPSLKGGHSLAAWGERVRLPKLEYTDFSRYTVEMEEYCMVDTRLCCRVFILLSQRMREIGFTDNGLDIEHRSWQLIRKQQENGFAFNIVEAHILYTKIRGIENDLKHRIEERWPPELTVVKTCKRPYKKDGTPTSNHQRHNEQYVDIRIREDADEYDCFDWVHFNIGSPTQRVEKLLELGWRPSPDELTKAGNPSPTKKGKLVPSLERFIEDGENEPVRLIAQWIEYNARANMINTWIEAYNNDTKAIHGRLWLANTLRYRHTDPNTANITAVRLDKQENPVLGEAGRFTFEARDLWVSRASNRVLVGVDAKGIQLRVLAHYLNNPEFIEAVLNGDPHSYNQEIGGFATRSQAKTFVYSFLLGAGDAKVGEIIGGTPRDGRNVKAKFVGNFPGLSDLLDDLERQVERTGRIILCDGTPLLVTKPHTRLGYLLQGDESRIMKKAAILTDIEIRKRRLDVLKVCDVHDEHQYDVLTRHSEELANDICPQAFALSGSFFKYRLPIHCSSKIGLTWARSH